MGPFNEWIERTKRNLCYLILRVCLRSDLKAEPATGILCKELLREVPRRNPEERGEKV